MDDLTRFPKADPVEIFRNRDGLYAPELLAAATIGLDFFSWLAQTPADAGTICASLGLAARPVDVMLTLFTAMGLVQEKGGVFHLTDASREFLVPGSPWFVAPYFSSFRARPVYKDLLEVLRTGKPAGWISGTAEKPWAQAMESDAFAEQFTAAMDSRGVILGPALARQLDLQAHHRLLDIAGGSGIYACCLVSAHRHLAATVVEKPPVDRVARKGIEKRGYSGQVDVIVGDIFSEDLPAGYDVHLWSNALHDWDAPAVQTLLVKSSATLPSGGMIVIHDEHINREKTGPLAVAAYSAFLMTITEGKCYAVSELESFLKAAGFAGVEYRTTTGDHSVITARKP